ncbi:MAG: HAMP domain-containing histidine kinase [Bacteroidetes bacterium]|jgi:signal transduction histidine kinase|nr:HAMP domain-containing histidine kinase [Bacteroidota bacterium]MBT4410578.1 HAMP domain-containing histidine kinase [Bacteroidota bacterium]MBT7465724.1 HAMP domain-containing histidine kinase [Bacteroidota bacterium]
MSPVNPRKKFRRLVVLYTMAIVLPGSILGFMAYRGIMGQTLVDEQLMEQRLTRRYDAFVKAIEDTISKCYRYLSPGELSWVQDQLILNDSGVDKGFLSEGLIVAIAGSDHTGSIAYLNMDNFTGIADKMQDHPYQTLVSNLAVTIKKGLNHQQKRPLWGVERYYPFYQDSLAVLITFLQYTDYALSILFDEQELVERASPLLDKQGVVGKIHWQIRNHEDKTVCQDTAFYRSRHSFKSFTKPMLGAFEVRLWEEENEWFADRNYFYYTMGFVLIILIISIGLLLVFRALAKEYQLANLKSEFISTVSHEFKSPITSIRQMSEMLMQGRMRSEERKLDYYSSMLAQSEQLSHLVNNILDFSRLEEGEKKYRMEDCDLIKSIQKVIDLLLIKNRQAGFKIDFRHPDQLNPVKADCNGIIQVVYNLLDNAIKYSGQKRKVEVELTPINNQVVIRVIDFGFGMSKKDIRRIFSRFYRSDVVILKGINGSGIGLAIVKRIVQAHAGRIEVISEPGKGSTFTLMLPYESIQNHEKNTNN